MQDKKKIRDLINKRKSLLNREIKEILDDNIFNKIIKSEAYKRAETIFIYVSFSGEVDTHRLIEYALKDNKVVCIPKVISKKDGMKAVQINSLKELTEGLYGILEPSSFQKEVSKDKIDLVFMPGVAFDMNGGRVGYGGGFYDKFLKEVSKDTIKIALAYDFQILNKVPIEPHDEKVNGIITN